MEAAEKEVVAYDCSFLCTIFAPKGGEGMDGAAQSMIVLTPAELWAGILAICGGISCIAGAIVWIYKGIKAMQSPNQKQDKRLAELEA